MSLLRTSLAVVALFLVVHGSAQTTSPNPPSTNAGAKATDSTEIEVARAVKAIYPNEAFAQSLQGQVVVKVIISETGDVEKPEVISGDPVLAKAAIEAAKQWKFKPFIQNGKAVKIATRIPFDFAFGENVSDIPQTITAADGTKRALVSEGISKNLLIHRVQPEYPEIASSHRVEGAVVLHAIIGKDGKIKDLKAVSGPEMLVRPAIGAVQQWRYKPFMLLGEPIEVETKIVVNFQLAAK
jgi:TonB family protein